MKKFFVLMMAMVLCLNLAACGGNSSGTATPANGGGASTSANNGGASDAAGAEEYDEVVIKLAHPENEQSNEHKGALKFEELVEERSGGKVQVEVFPNGQLGSENAMLESTQLNAVQMTITSCANIGKLYNPALCFNLSYFLEGDTEAEQYETLKKITEDGELLASINEGLPEAAGLVLVTLRHWYGNRNLTSNKAVATPADMAGLKVRTPDQDLYVKTLGAAGAAVTPLDFNEVYMALKMGTIDGQENPNATIENKKFYEVQKYVCTTGHITQIQAPTINADFFNSLNPATQQLIMDCYDEAAVWQSEQQAKDNDGLLDTLAGYGLTVVEADRAAFKEAVSGVAAELLDDSGMAMYNRIAEKVAELS